jgi:hypothetical protein
MTFAVLRPHFTNLGKVKDISRGGLVFEYIPRERQNAGSPEIDIFLSGERFYLPRIPSKIIYNIKIVKEYQGVTTGIEKRRCGLEFGELSEEQAAKLDFFLENHTTGTA